jgi:hypothetical protein
MAVAGGWRAAFMVVIEDDGHKIETMPRGNICQPVRRCGRHCVMAVRRGQGIALMTLQIAETALIARSNAVQAAYQSIL